MQICRRPKALDSLSQVLASGAMARVVRYFAVNPGKEVHFQGLRRSTGLSPRSLQDEIKRLVDVGILVRVENDDESNEQKATGRGGRRVRYVVDARSPVWMGFRSLARLLSTPADVLPLALADVPGIDGAFIYGSHASGHARPDSDVDVLLIGDEVDARTLFRHTLDAGALLDREVNVVQVTRDELSASVRSGFLSRVLECPKQWLIGSDELLTRGAANPDRPFPGVTGSAA